MFCIAFITIDILGISLACCCAECIMAKSERTSVPYVSCRFSMFWKFFSASAVPSSSKTSSVYIEVPVPVDDL